MLRSRLSGIEVLKVDILGTLTVLGHDAKSYMGPMVLHEGNAERAKGLRLRLRRADEGWSLNRAN
jgi:hypothetical protein